MPAVLSLPWLLLLAATAGRTDGHQFGNIEAQEGHQEEMTHRPTPASWRAVAYWFRGEIMILLALILVAVATRMMT
jgi:hypothetical protein